jgi:hypothetical protein
VKLSLLCYASHHQSHRSPPASTLNHSKDYRHAEKNNRDDGIAEDDFAGASDTENNGTATPLTQSLSSQTSDLGPAGALSCLIVHNRVADNEMKAGSLSKDNNDEDEDEEDEAEGVAKQPDDDNDVQAGSFSKANDDDDDDDEDDSGLDSPGSDAYVLNGADGRGKGRGKQTPKRPRY